MAGRVLLSCYWLSGYYHYTDNTAAIGPSLYHNGGIRVSVTRAWEGYTDSKVCKGPGCTQVFAVGEGGGRLDRLYCSNACKQKAYRKGGPVTKTDKLKEISSRQVNVAMAMQELAEQMEQLTIESDALCHAAGVARGENWADAWEEMALLREAAENREDYEGF